MAASASGAGARPDHRDHCQQCGGAGPGQYADMIMFPMWPKGAEPHCYTVFYCDACIRGQAEEEAAEREFLGEVEWQRQREQHKAEFTAMMDRSGVKRH